MTNERPFSIRATLAVLLLALTLLPGCGAPEAPTDTTPPPEEARTSVTLTDEQARAAGIETAPVRYVERTDPVQASGLVGFDERRTARLGSLVEGVVHDLDVQPGDRVAAGAVVARLHSHVVHDAWAAYFKARAERQRLETERAYARTVAARAATLVTDKALSPQELERARADEAAVDQAIVAAEAEIVRTEQDLRHYGITPRGGARPQDDQDVPVTSPYAGVVVERLATEGSAVTPGTPLLVISDLSRVWVMAEIDESLVGRVEAGAPATIAAAAYPGETFTGRLAHVGDIVNPATRRVTLRIEAANADRRLKPQMFVTAQIGAAAPRRVLAVPSRAVQAMDGEMVVFVRGASGQFVRRAVVTGVDRDGDVEIVRGLEEGEVVATAGAFLLKSDLLKPAGDDEP